LLLLEVIHKLWMFQKFNEPIYSGFLEVF
jgi:hypothetical protein